MEKSTDSSPAGTAEYNLRALAGKPLILAPMAGFTDHPFRLLCRRHGADWAVSEMISAKAMCFGDRKTALLSQIPAGDAPVALQIFGHEPEAMAKAAKMLAEGSFDGCRYEEKPAFIDINMGCPVKKIVTSGDGSALMQSPETCRKIVSRVYEALSGTGVGVSVKIRAGRNAAEKNAVEIASACAAEGAGVVTVHARTREQMYRPGIDLDIIRDVRRTLPPEVKVVGNGDISSAEDAAKMAEYTGCDALMIGRAALGDPWLFEEIKAAAAGKDFCAPDNAARIETAREFVREIVKLYGEEAGIKLSRGRAAHFIKGMRGAPEVRDLMNRAATLKEFDAALSSLI